MIEIGEPAVDALSETLQHEDSHLRILAAWTLGEIRDARAIGPLIAALKDEDFLSRQKQRKP
jgi:HEAT repeat protein